MKRIKSDELTKLSDEELVKRLNELRSNLVTLRSKAARGVLKKELGEIKTVRRNIARVMTVISLNENVKEKSIPEKVTKESGEKPSS